VSASHGQQKVIRHRMTYSNEGILKQDVMLLAESKKIVLANLARQCTDSYVGKSKLDNVL
jgi:hypothetical protein